LTDEARGRQDNPNGVLSDTADVTQITMHFQNQRMSWLIVLRMQTYRYE